MDYPFRPSHIWAGFHPIEWRHLHTRFGFTLGLPQNMTEDLLWAWAQECGAQIRRGAEVTALRQHAEGVEVDVQDTRQAQGAVTTLRAKYLVGADGDAAWCVPRRGLHSRAGRARSGAL